MQLKMYTPINPKSVFEKIKFKVLHYIQYDFIRQHLELSKDQTSMFKGFVVNCLSQDIEILGWCPARPVLPHGEKVPL